jgi:gamma-glutamylcyclotransferase (GGCT)/AIG2-like uncharacterized protein YtfP
MHAVLAAHASLVGRGTVRGGLRPVREHAALVPRDDSATLVNGEIYEIRPATEQHLWTTLDAYEGIGDPAFDEYRREAITATLNDGRAVRAWAYVLKQ